MGIEEFQRRIEAIYYQRDSARGLAGMSLGIDTVRHL